MATSNSSDILRLVDQVKAAADKNYTDSSPETHADLLKKINDLKLAVETPTETVLRIIYQPPQNAALRIVTDLGIFDHLVEAGKHGHGVSAAELTNDTGAAEDLIARLMRVMASLGLCSSPESGVYIANSKTSIMTEPTGKDGVRCIYDLTLPTLSKLPAFLKFTNYVNPTEYLRSPMAYAVGQSQFEWLADHKKQQSWFNSYMASRREGKQNWFDIYPVNRVIQEAARFDDVHTRHHSHGHENGGEEAEHHDKTPHRNEEKVFLVDIGGNQGHDLVKLRKRLGSEFRAKLVLQDLPSVLESSSNTDGIEKMAYSFLEPQPVKGAYIYFFRSIFHDWPDDTCRKILLNTKSAMDPVHSRIIIVDFVLSDTDTPLIQSSMDIQMMSIGAGVERSERQWKELLQSAGFVIRGIWNFSPGMESVIEAAPDEGSTSETPEQDEKKEPHQKNAVANFGAGINSVQAQVETLWLQRAFGVGRP